MANLNGTRRTSARWVRAILKLSGCRSSTAPKVAVFNEAFAHYYFGAENPIGHAIDRGIEDGGLTEIVGVVKDAKTNDIRERTPRTFYVPFLQDRSSWRETTFEVRTNI